MISDPPRLSDDPRLPRELRDLMSRADEAPVEDLDIESGIVHLRAEVYECFGLSSPGSGGGGDPSAGGAGGGGSETGGAGGGDASGGMTAAHAGAASGAGAVGGAVGSAIIGGLLGGLVVVAVAVRSHLDVNPRENTKQVVTLVVDAGAAADAREREDTAPHAEPDASVAPKATASNTPSVCPRGPREEPEDAHMNRIHEAPAAERLQLVQEGHQRYPHGSFYSEREFQAVRALVELGRRAEARSRIHAYLEGHPNGYYAGQMRDRLRALEGDGGQQ